MYLAGLHYHGVEIWDYQSKVHLASLKATRCPEGMGYGRSFCFSPDGKMLATLTANAMRVVVWDVETINDCKVMYELNQPEFNHYAHCVCFSKNSESLIVGYGRKVILYEAVTGSVQQTSEWHTDIVIFIQHVGDVYLSASSNGALLEMDSHLVYIRDMKLGPRISSVCISPSESKIAVCTDAIRIFILDTATWEASVTLGDVADKVSYVGNLQFSVDEGKLLAVAYGNTQRIYVYDMRSGSLVYERDAIGHVCYDSDSSCLLSSRPGGEMVCWNAENGSDNLENVFPVVQLLHNRTYERLLVFAPGTMILM
jgi:WD40 repeat protein